MNWSHVTRRRRPELDAVDRRLARFGYKKMTVEGLAEEAGIGKGTVYLHFASKEEAVLSHVDRIVERLCGRLDTIAAGDGRAPAQRRAQDPRLRPGPCANDGARAD
jgi:AcrR family transcriptional regulator